jgi:uncharacterized protein YjbI with pentapeptide repeats
MADFSECDLQGASFHQARAPQSHFVRADLRGANLVGADLFEALLSKAVLDGADLSGSNLYQADMALVRGDAETSLRDAITTRVRTKPLYSDKVQDLD